MNMASKTSQNPSIQFENKIHIDQRFAQRQKEEYNVFSTDLEDATKVEKWVGLQKPFRVLMDPASYEKLKNNRLKWVFNDDKVLVGCNIIT